MLSYSEQRLVNVAKENAELLGLSWKRIVDHFAWPNDDQERREFRAADHSFYALTWKAVSDWFPHTFKKGDWVWLPELGVVQVEMSGEKRARCLVNDMTMTVSPSTLEWGVLIPADKVDLAKALLNGFWAGRSVSRFMVELETASVLRIRVLLGILLGK